MQDLLGPGVFKDSLCHCKLLPSVHCFPLCLAQTEQATESCDNKTDFIKIAGSEAWGIIWGRGDLFFFCVCGGGEWWWMDSCVNQDAPYQGQRAWPPPSGMSLSLGQGGEIHGDPV